MEAYPEKAYNLPLNSNLDAEKGYHLYTREVPFLSQGQIQGAYPYSEPEDNFFNKAIQYPWITDRRPYDPQANHNESTTQPSLSPDSMLNNQYSQLMKSHFPESGYNSAPKSWGSNWEKLLAYHHGLYQPTMNSTSLTAEDILIKTNKFSDTLELDDPKDPCRMLAVKEFECLNSMQSFMDPYGASKKCVKWFNEWQQCKWDHEKFVKGYNYLEDQVATKHKAYAASPDPQYS